MIDPTSTAPETVVGYKGLQYVKPSTEQMVERLLAAVAFLATEADVADQRVPRISAEYAIEVILYPEHFPPGTLVHLRLQSSLTSFASSDLLPGSHAPEAG